MGRCSSVVNRLDLKSPPRNEGLRDSDLQATYNSPSPPHHIRRPAAVSRPTDA
ncbi:hypothetical protein CC78DRAFT_529334 [Lojkania enalia]|uniref:Uncharacterized protein n=1 Tax=Lojkania enalia TaxID=147567 RepID=A0A9P4NAJ8_9PLEO|nr:hypothetical protein CC78DRAFT_529334 [Didymosphaeria enalia]